MYMLLLVDKEENGFASGNWIQWCCACSFAEAEKRARDAEQVNGNRITVAVVEALYDPYRIHYSNLRRLDKS